MKKLFLIFALIVTAVTSRSQNVGIGDPSPAAKLTIKSDQPSNRTLLVKNLANDTSFFISGNNIYMNGLFPVPIATLTISNKSMLPFDDPQLSIVAVGENTGSFPNGSQSQIEFANYIHPNKRYWISAYTGNMENSWSLKHFSPTTFTKTLLSFRENGLGGIGTSTPTARLQINHSSSSTFPTLKLYDSAINIGPVIQFANAGGPQVWQIQSTINNATDRMDITYTGSVMTSLNNNGNFGIGTFTPQYKLQLNNTTANSVHAHFTNLTTGSIFSDGLIIGVNSAGNASITNQESTKLYLGTAGVNRVTITETGRVGIGIDPPTESLDINGNFNASGLIRVTGEVNRPATGTAHLLPVAYGNISSTGFINAGSGNITATRTGTGNYNIAITGESYHYQTHIAVVTPSGIPAPIFVSTGSGGGSLLVTLMDINGNPIDYQFHFVVYRQ